MRKDASDFHFFADTLPETSNNKQTYTCITLHKLVNQVIAGLPSRTAKQIEFIANDVQERMLVSTDKDTLGIILGFLLSTTTMYSQNNTIRLSAKLIGSITLIHVKTSDTGNSDIIAEDFHKIQPLAEKLGGCITVSNYKMHGISLAFTFINQ